jgi:hypothetical protein
MSDNVIGCFAIAFRLCCNPVSFELLLGLRGRLRENKPSPENHPAHRQGQPVHNSSPAMSIFRVIAANPWAGVTSTLHLTSERAATPYGLSTVVW